MANFFMKGFPDVSPEVIELPNIAELLFYPSVCGLAEDVYKKAPDFYKTLLDKAPLQNNKKYVTVASQLQFLHPGVRTNPNTPGFVIEDDQWHYDAHINHIFISEASCSTEFNVKPMLLDIDERVDLAVLSTYIHQNQEKLGIQTKRIPHNQFVTFDIQHMHKATQPTQIEFRFFMKIVESDTPPFGDLPENILRYSSAVFKPFHTPDAGRLPSVALDKERGHLTIYPNFDIF